MKDVYSLVKSAVTELLERSGVGEGQIVVIGCSTSEILGRQIGHGSCYETAEQVFSAAYGVLSEHKVSLAAQCCEHLNRALIVERQTALKYGLEIVNVMPVPNAGGSFAAAAWNGFKDPVAVEFIKADAGLDIGQTLIGMHLKHVAVPVRLEVRQIGQAVVTAARTRYKFIGGARAHYPEGESR